MKYSRRNLLQSISALAGASMLPIAADAGTTPAQNLENVPGDLDELVNLFDFEKMARAKMSNIAYGTWPAVPRMN